MKTGFLLFAMFSAPFGILYAAQGAMAPPEPVGRSCVKKKIVAYGYAQPEIALAEMAAIVIWQKEAAKRRTGFSDWHLAKKRVMNCRQFKKSGHFQCVLSATPCHMDRS